jgi:hypothetical protein
MPSAAALHCTPGSKRMHASPFAQAADAAARKHMRATHLDVPLRPRVPQLVTTDAS